MIFIPWTSIINSWTYSLSWRFNLFNSAGIFCKNIRFCWLNIFFLLVSLFIPWTTFLNKPFLSYFNLMFIPRSRIILFFNCSSSFSWFFFPWNIFLFSSFFFRYLFNLVFMPRCSFNDCLFRSWCDKTFIPRTIILFFNFLRFNNLIFRPWGIIILLFKSFHRSLYFSILFPWCWFFFINFLYYFCLIFFPRSMFTRIFCGFICRGKIVSVNLLPSWSLMYLSWHIFTSNRCCSSRHCLGFLF